MTNASGDDFDGFPPGLAAPAPARTTKPRRAVAAKVPVTAFRNDQLDLFQNFLANTDAQRNDLSNAVELWDSVPRYSISRIAQNKLRSPDGMLPIRNVPFDHRGKSWVAQIRPARLEVRGEDGTPTGKTMEFYPSAREELIEHALRKLATEANAGFFDKPGHRSGVTFSLHQLRLELRKRGHAMTYEDLVEGLDVMNLANLRLVEKSANPKHEEPILISEPILPVLARVGRRDLARDPEARWLVQFHAILTDSFDRIAYRQFNYTRFMAFRTQLARWLFNQLVLKYTQASPINSFSMKYSTVRRDSALLDGYAQTKRAVEALDDALEELRSQDVLLHIRKEVQRSGRGRIEDVAYELIPTVRFAGEQKAANRRRKDAAPVQLAG